jgi:hypothetical protein
MEDLKDEKYSPIYATKSTCCSHFLVSPSFFPFFTPAFQLIADINKIGEGAKGWKHERGTKCYRCVIVP